MIGSMLTKNIVVCGKIGAGKSSGQPDRGTGDGKHIPQYGS